MPDSIVQASTYNFLKKCIKAAYSTQTDWGKLRGAKWENNESLSEFMDHLNSWSLHGLEMEWKMSFSSPTVCYTLSRDFSF